MSGDTIKKCSEELRGSKPHILECLVDQQFVQGQLISGNICKSLCLCLDEPGKLVRLYHVGYQTYAESGFRIDGSAGEEELFRMLEPKAIYPQHRGRRPVNSTGRIADMCVTRHEQQITAEHQIGRPANGPPFDLPKYGFRTFPDTHESFHIVAHELQIPDRIPRTRAFLDFRRPIGYVPGFPIGQVITRGEGIPYPAKDNGGNLFRTACLIDSIGNLLDDAIRQGVFLLRTVDGNDRDSVSLFIQDFFAHDRFLLLPSLADKLLRRSQVV